jgi:hypothetical protein
MGLMISPMWCTSPRPTCLLVMLQIMPVADYEQQQKRRQQMQLQVSNTFANGGGTGGSLHVHKRIRRMHSAQVQLHKQPQSVAPYLQSISQTARMVHLSPGWHVPAAGGC